MSSVTDLLFIAQPWTPQIVIETSESTYEVPQPAQSLPTLFPITTRNGGLSRAITVNRPNQLPARMPW
jgi:hypothetical protein